MEEWSRLVYPEDNRSFSCLSTETRLRAECKINQQNMLWLVGKLLELFFFLPNIVRQYLRLVSMQVCSKIVTAQASSLTHV